MLVKRRELFSWALMVVALTARGASAETGASQKPPQPAEQLPCDLVTLLCLGRSSSAPWPKSDIS